MENFDYEDLADRFEDTSNQSGGTHSRRGTLAPTKQGSVLF